MQPTLNQGRAFYRKALYLPLAQHDLRNWLPYRFDDGICKWRKPMKGMTRICAAAALVAALMHMFGCQKANQTAETHPSAVALERTEAKPAVAAKPAFMEGHPDKKPMITTATVTKVRSINDLDARLRLAVVQWSKPTGETVSNVIVCQADGKDCMRLNIGERYTMTWFQHNALYAVYQTQGYQTVALNTGVYAAWARGEKRENFTQAEYANSIMTAYAVVDLSKEKAKNLREWAMSE
jgi:hypothetical protein